MNAYIDSLGDVIATSTKNLTLSEAQSLNPNVVTVIKNAPEKLLPKRDKSLANHYKNFHHYVSFKGDGSSLDHYELKENLESVKMRKKKEIDLHTKKILDIIKRAAYSNTTIQQIGDDLKSQIDLATTEAEIDAVVDTR